MQNGFGTHLSAARGREVGKNYSCFWLKSKTNPATDLISVKNNRNQETIRMKKLVILGHGTGDTTIAAKMRQQLPEKEWQITVIDRDWQYHYQSGWLLIPFGIYTL
jgi:hypothetical protein